jgi:protein tyrosine phosphatase
MPYIPPNKNLTNDELYNELIKDEDCSLMIHCVAENGITGDWVRLDALNGRISPIFHNLFECFHWLSWNGFIQTGSGTGHVRKYRKVL